MNISSFLRTLKGGSDNSVPVCVCGANILKNDLKRSKIKLDEYVRTKEVIEHCYGAEYATHISNSIDNAELDVWRLEKLIPIEQQFDEFVKQIIEKFNMTYIGYTDDRITDSNGNSLKGACVFKLLDVNDCESGYVLIEKEKPYSDHGEFRFNIGITYVFDTLEYEEILSATNTDGYAKAEKANWIHVYNTHKDCDEFQKAQFCYLRNKISEMFNEFIDKTKDSFHIGFRCNGE